MILDINAFVGRVDAAVIIRDLLINAKVMTATFVNRRAISAGALIGIAAEKIVMADAAAIGFAATHKDVLENPDHIAKHVLTKGLDAGTAYEILSIDIADVDVGENIGAKLQIDQANADKQIAQAKAEERRAMAVALEQEMSARVVDAEAEAPRAMAEAFRQGNLGVMDYYRMKNVPVDTDMREAITGLGDEPSPGQTR